MATKTGTALCTLAITNVPSAYCKNAENAIDGNESTFASLSLKHSNPTSSFGWGSFTFSITPPSLSHLTNAKITGIKWVIKGKTDGSGYDTSLKFCFVKSGTGTTVVGTSLEYTEISNGSQTNLTYAFTESNFGTAFANLVASPTTPLYARVIGKNAYIGEVTVSVTYTYEETTYTVSTSVTPEGAGTVSPASQEVESGATASVTAIPNEGYRFSHWLIGGANSGITTLTLSGTITADILCTAVFEKLPPEFTAAEMIYSGNQISNSNKVIAGESFVISVGVT